MPIEATVTGPEQITASVTETQVAVGVSGGMGPTGPPNTDASLLSSGTVPDARLDENIVRTTDSRLSNARIPTQHAASHAVGGTDVIAPAAIGAATIAAAESLQLQVDGKAANSHTHAASAITSGTINSARLPLATGSVAGAIIVGTGLAVASGVTSVSYGSSGSSACVGNDSRLSDSREWSASTVTQVEAESGSSTTRRAFTPQRVFQAIAAWWAGSADKSKLDGIASGATANASDAQLRDRSTHTGTQAISTVSGLQDALDGKQASGTYATLVGGTVPSAQLPSYVDDVMEAANLAALPGAGETSKIYVTLDTNKTYRWSGSAYVEISPSPGSTDSVTEGSTNLYFTTGRAAAAAPVQSVAGRAGTVTLAKADVGLGNVDNTSDANKPISTATQSALDGKVSTSDSRLTDSREWSADTVSQAEAEAGTATTRRAWTAVRVWQAIAAWWATVTVSVAKGGTGATTQADARTNLGLGTLATQSGTFSGTSSGTNTGDQTITLTGDVTGSGTGSFAATIANNAVTGAKIDSTTSITCNFLTVGNGISAKSLLASDWLGVSAGVFVTPVGFLMRGTSTGSNLFVINTSGQVTVGEWQGTAVAVAYGGTGATTQSGARTNLGLGGSATLNVGTTAGTVAAGDHTHTQLHDRSHAITSTSDHTAGNWKVIHTNGSGQVVELALGASGTVLTSGGASAAPSFSALPAGGTKSIVTFTASNNQPPASGYATLDTRNSVLVLEFDASSDESAIFCGYIPEGATLTNGVKVRLSWMSDTQTTGNVRWGVQFEADGTDMDSDSFDTATLATSAANGTCGIETVAEITATNIDSLAAGDRFRLKVYRDADDATNDTMTGDAQLVAVEVQVA